ncbi:lasso peptide biosynthesis B2 protein [Prauserella muralis]|uniref:Microcin J25-processing protein McjB C-terminal domain-containing protein n=1 Tax=Prauserella muralis TaxID=588067 RepID=A0A2V4ABW4_9PSEU|nr:lasso peptide biosynthesis B2 protein [Prauserella muralis]PXY16578.1 hypothetical protein BAY60_35875 [Prauserella muralis]TWE11181.1 transglutaminase superfamily protein [Prauserella muralis]
MSAPVVLEQQVPLSRGERLRALTAVATARLLLAATRARPARLRRLLQLLVREGRPASLPMAVRARAAVVTVSLHAASDHGCLLRSIAILLACRAAGYTLTWRVGVVSPPPASHAWVEADDTPVGEPFDPRLLYSPIITVRPCGKGTLPR